MGEVFAWGKNGGKKIGKNKGVRRYSILSSGQDKIHVTQKQTQI
jgi:hypothetical protein